MNTIKINIAEGQKVLKEYTYTLPSSPDELTPKQFRMIARVISSPGDSLEKKMEILMRLAKITRPDLFDPDMVIEALKLLDFLDDNEIQLKEPIIKWIFPFKAPKRRMIGFTGGQMALCDTILNVIEGQETIPTQLLNDFCAANTTLFKLPWSNFIAEYIAKPFFKYLVRRKTKLALIIQYRAMRRIFPQSYENAFDSNPTYERFPSLGWSGTIVRLAGDKFGTPAQVRRTPAHELFTCLEQARRDEIRNTPSKLKS